MITTLIPSCTDKYLARCLTSMEARRKFTLRHTIVADSGLTPDAREHWSGLGVRFVNVPQPFVFAHAVNLAAKYADPADHLFVLNDDTEAITDDWYDKLGFVMNHHPPVGLLAAMIEGSVGNPDQQTDRTPATVGQHLVASGKTLCFTAVLIRREVWDVVGELDERYTGYGFDDDDYCRRARLAGWETGVTGLVVFKHGVPGYALSSSFLRKHDAATVNRMFHENRLRYIQKWGGMPT